MLLHAEIALRRLFEIEAEIQPVTVVRIFRMEIAIEFCDFVFVASGETRAGLPSRARRGTANFR